MILIKDMQMPESCFDCEIQYDNMCCSVTGTSFWIDGDPLHYDTKPDPNEERMPDCPLVEVEPYGIDGLLYKEK